MSKHKKCPFCGGRAMCTCVEQDYENVYYVFCMSCSAEVCYRPSEVEAWAAWDRRDDDAVKELVEEHRTWAQEFGAALVMALQGDYSRVDDLAHDLIIDFPDGVPSIRSRAIKEVEGL